MNELQQQIISSILNYKTAIFDAIKILHEEDFVGGYKDIFIACKQLVESSVPVDTISVSRQLKKNNSDVDSSELVSISTTGTNLQRFATYCYYLKEKSLLDKIKVVGIGAANDIDQNKTLDEVLDNLLYQLNDIQGEIRRASPKPTLIADHLKVTLDEIYENERKFEKGEYVGIKTPLADLNHLTGGWQNGDLIIIAARPSMGKTSFAIKSGTFAADKGFAVNIFSLEMTSRQLVMKIISEKSGVDVQNMKNGTLTKEERGEIEVSVNRILQQKILIDDTPSVGISYISSAAKINKMKGVCDMVIIDYLGLMQMPKAENTNLAIGRITSMAKAMAKDLDVPVILLSQLNRAVEQRGNKRPMLSDLRDSGNIEQDADLVLFMYRPFYYSQDIADKGYGEIIVAKHRNGSTGVVRFKHNENMTDFYDSDDNFPTPEF